MTLAELRSPFRPTDYPPADLFVGRHEEIRDFLQRIVQLKDKDPYGFVILGERSVGKSSFANYVLAKTENTNESGIQLHHVAVDLATMMKEKSPMNLFFKRTIEEIVTYMQKNKSTSFLKSILGSLGKIDSVGVFGLTASWKSENIDELTLQSIFEKLVEKLAETQELGDKKNMEGFVLSLENINGLAQDVIFARYLKGMMDTYARLKMPFSLVICAQREAWEAVRKGQESTPRHYYPIVLGALKNDTVRDFFIKAFKKVGMENIDEEGLQLMTHVASGQPYFMQEIGDAVFRRFVNDNNDDFSFRISMDHVKNGILNSLVSIAQKHLNSQILDLIQSETYIRILKETEFTDRESLDISKGDIREITERLGLKKSDLNNFCKKMRDIGVLKFKDDTGKSGKYEFTSEFLRLYLRAYAIFGKF